MKLPVWKKLAFAAVTVGLFFVILEGLLWVCDVRPLLFYEDPYVGFTSAVPVFVEQPGPDGRAWMVTAQNKVLFFNRQRFLKEKPRDTFRIFCVGGSTTFGRPYSDRTAFSGWLKAFLFRADPARHWDIINAGGISYASYRVALLMEQLIAYEPDLFIIYTGHNEFLERRTYHGVIETPEAVRGLGALLGRTRTFALATMFVDALSSRTREESAPPSLLEGEVETLLDHAVGPTAFHRDDELRAGILDHFQFNLARMIDIAESAGAEVILVTPASNLKDCSPFKSEHAPGLDAQDFERWQALYDQAVRAREAGDPAVAVPLLEETVGIDPRHAHAQYYLGRALYETGRFEEARAAFLRARNEDICPLRALTRMIEIVREVAAARGVLLVDFAALVEERSPHATPGDNLFLDHVHPTIEGHRALGLALLDEMVRMKLLDPVPEWNGDAVEEATRAVMDGIDEKTHGLALRNLSMVIAWAGKYEEAYRLAAESLKKVPLDVDANFQFGVCAMALEKNEEAERAFKRASELEPKAASPHTFLGDLYQRQGLVEQAIEEYRTALSLDPDEDEARMDLAEALAELECYEEALREIGKVLKRNPEEARARRIAAELQGKLRQPRGRETAGGAAERVRQGTLLAGQGRFAEAVDAFREALEMEASLAGAKNHLARLLASAPDPALRNGEEALRLAREACEHSEYKNAIHLDTMAIAYAEIGRFDEAVDAAKKALKLARDGGRNRLASQIEGHLQLFEDRAPVRISLIPSKPDPGRKNGSR